MRLLIRFSTFIYSIIIICWFLLNQNFGDGFWWLTILNQITPLLFVPLPFLFVAKIVARKWYQVAIILIPCAIFVWMEAPHLAPIFPIDSQQQDIRVMTYNVLYLNENYDHVAQVIRSMKPDLVALQEVEEAMLNALVEELGDLYPYQAVAQQPDWQWNTTVVLSQYPLLETETIDLEEIRPAMLVRVDVAGRPLTFISAHLYFYNWWMFPLSTIPSLINERTKRQNRQTEILLEKIELEQNDLILACDCNSRLPQSSYKMLRQVLDNAQSTIATQFRQPPIAGTSFDRDMFNVDYILYRGTLEPIGAYSVDDAGGSDHKAMIADFIFPAETID